MPVGVNQMVKGRANPTGGAPRVILCTLGTLGDVRPFVLMAEELCSRGLLVEVLTNENWAALVRQTGASFIPIAPADPPQDGRDDFAFFKRNILPSFHHSYRRITDKVGEHPRPFLVFRSGMLGASCAAEKYSLHALRVVLQPSALESRARPPWPLSILADGMWGPVGRNFLVPLALACGNAFSRYRLYIERFRTSTGLPARSKRQENKVPTAVLCPAWFCGPGDPKVPGCTYFGFPFSKGTASAENRFDTRGAIIFTPGTGRVDVEGYTHQAASICRELKRPGLVLSRHAPSNGPIRVINHSDLAPLLPGALALVHHGGIGTTAEAIRAGIPQLIIANRFDQPDNAFRVAQLGLGAAILKDQPDAKLIADTLMKAITSNHIATQISTAKHLLEQNSAINSVCDRIVASLPSQGGTREASEGRKI